MRRWLRLWVYLQLHLSVNTKFPSLRTGSFRREFTWENCSLKFWPGKEEARKCVQGLRQWYLCIFTLPEQGRSRQNPGGPPDRRHRGGSASVSSLAKSPGFRNSKCSVPSTHRGTLQIVFSPTPQDRKYHPISLAKAEFKFSEGSELRPLQRGHSLVGGTGWDCTHQWVKD